MSGANFNFGHYNIFKDQGVSKPINYKEGRISGEKYFSYSKKNTSLQLIARDTEI